jgi:flagellar protein FliL
MPAALRAEPVRGNEEKHDREPETESVADAEPAKENQAASWKAWLPLGIALVVMPLVAYGLTTFILVPQMQKRLQSQGLTPAPAAQAGHGETAVTGGEGSAPGGAQQTAVLNKLLVNVAGTMGSRYLLASLTLNGADADFQRRVSQNDAKLRDLACGLLCTKTIADLEKPGARNEIRGELIAGFNNILGNSAVQDIYFTEFAIQ